MLKFFDKLYNRSAKDFYEILKNNLEKETKTFIVTANPETFTIGQNNSDFSKLLLDKNTILVPDGIGIVKSAQMLDYNVTERITGIDLASELLKICHANHYKLALLGASNEVLIKLEHVINTEYKNIEIVASNNGYISDEEKDKFFENLAKKEVDVCLVALGIPKQEQLIYKHLNKFNKGIFMGVGGSFDVLSGTKKRAPKLFQKLNIEWLYRILKEPKRLKRFYDNNVKFLFKIKKIKKKQKNE